MLFKTTIVASTALLSLTLAALPAAAESFHGFDPDAVTATPPSAGDRDEFEDFQMLLPPNPQ